MASEPTTTATEPTTSDLIETLRADRLWLLRQIDAGRWPEWRLDLAALERELGQLLDQVSEHQASRPTAD
ncbi:MAG: hypothetical protein NTX18_05845 [Cyanobium sp. LacPavin_0818_WC50_MAG_67_9]|nr:hypothetical protein [Cyanobium sp. LacPavin_0818_WC50_MAG_67_9]